VTDLKTPPTGAVTVEKESFRVVFARVWKLVSPMLVMTLITSIGVIAGVMLFGATQLPSLLFSFGFAYLVCMDIEKVISSSPKRQEGTPLFAGFNRMPAYARVAISFVIAFATTSFAPYVASAMGVSEVMLRIYINWVAAAIIAVAYFITKRMSLDINATPLWKKFMFLLAGSALLGSASAAAYLEHTNIGWLYASVAFMMAQFGLFYSDFNDAQAQKAAAGGKDSAKGKEPKPTPAAMAAKDTSSQAPTPVHSSLAGRLSSIKAKLDSEKANEAFDEITGLLVSLKDEQEITALVVLLNEERFKGIKELVILVLLLVKELEGADGTENPELLARLTTEDGLRSFVQEQFGAELLKVFNKYPFENIFETIQTLRVLTGGKAIAGRIEEVERRTQAIISGSAGFTSTTSKNLKRLLIKLTDL
jgi:hypothetical protein